MQDGFNHLLDANLRRFPGGIYLGGKLSYNDAGTKEAYQFLPWGLVERCFPKASVPGLGEWACPYMITRMKSLPVGSCMGEGFDCVFESSDCPKEGSTKSKKLELALAKTGATFSPFTESTSSTSHSVLHSF